MAAVGRRVQEHLADDRRTTGVLRLLTRDRRDVRAGTPPGHRELSGHATEFLGVLCDPLHGGEAVVGSRREAMFGSVAIVDRHEDGVGLQAQIAAERIVGGVAAEHPAAPVEVRHDRVWAGDRRPVEPVLEFGAVGARERAVDDLADLGSGWTHRSRCLHERSGVVNRHRLDRGQTQLGHHLEHHLDIGLELADDAVVDDPAARPVEHEAEVVALDHLVARRAVPADATRVRAGTPAVCRGR